MVVGRSIILVYQCHDATIEEKHQAWNEIIETMPDCCIEGRRIMEPQESLHAFLKKYMEIEDELIRDFYDEKHDDTFSDPYLANASSTISYMFFSCIRAVSMIVRASQIRCPPRSLLKTTACFCLRLNLRSSRSLMLLVQSISG